MTTQVSNRKASSRLMCGDMHIFLYKNVIYKIFSSMKFAKKHRMC